MLVVFGRPFPRFTREMLDYLESLALGGCGRSLPGSVAAALRVMEVAGSVPVGRRISEDPVWLSAVRSLERECQQGGVPPSRANLCTVAVLVALELYVLSERPLFQRAFAWVKLVKVWACLRTDDVFGIDPARMRLTSQALVLVLRRTKTTGPGKKVQEVRCFVHRLACLSGGDWLAEGFRLWQLPDFCFPRGLLPSPAFGGPAGGGEADGHLLGRGRVQPGALRRAAGACSGAVGGVRGDGRQASAGRAGEALDWAQ
jgi:hypothetical protein